MKKVFSILLAATLLLSLFACSENGTPGAEDVQLTKFDAKAAWTTMNENIATAKTEYEGKTFRFTGDVIEIGTSYCKVKLYDGPKSDDLFSVTFALKTEELAKLKDGLAIDFSGEVVISSVHNVGIENAKLLEPTEVKNLSNDPNVIELEDATMKFTGAFWNDRCMTYIPGIYTPMRDVMAYTVVCEFTNNSDREHAVQDFIRIKVTQNDEEIDTEKYFGQEMHADIEAAPSTSIDPATTKIVGYAFKPRSDTAPVKVEVTDIYGRPLTTLEFTPEAQ